MLACVKIFGLIKLPETVKEFKELIVKYESITEQFISIKVHEPFELLHAIKTRAEYMRKILTYNNIEI